MLVPKIFRWLFFRKVGLTNVFEAIRNENALIVDVRVDLGHDLKALDNSIRLNDQNFNNFVQKSNQDQIIILVGNQSKRRMAYYERLKQHGFRHVFDLGNEQEYYEVKNQL